MSVSHKQQATHTTFNEAFLSRKVDTSTLGKIALQNASEESGDAIENVQRELNALASVLGVPVNQAKNAKPEWSSDEIGDIFQTVIERLEAISAKFNTATVGGHGHSGNPGDGPVIMASDIGLAPMRGVFVAGPDLSSVSGSSTDVSSIMASESPSLSSSSPGVVVDAPHNKVVIRRASGAQNEVFTDETGNIVYGRITRVDDTWTLSFYVMDGETETAYSFSSADVRWYYQELSTVLSGARVYSNIANLLPDNISAPATAVKRFAEVVTFNGSDLTKDVDVSDQTVTDAREAIWQLKDLSTEEFEILAVKITTPDADTVRITTEIALPSGDYKLIGIQ